MAEELLQLLAGDVFRIDIETEKDDVLFTPPSGVDMTIRLENSTTVYLQDGAGDIKQRAFTFSTTGVADIELKCLAASQGGRYIALFEIKDTSVQADKEFQLLQVISRKIPTP